MLPESSSVNSRFGSTLEPLAEASGTFEMSVVAADAAPTIIAPMTAWRIACLGKDGVLTMGSLSSRASLRSLLLAADHRLHDGYGIARPLGAHRDAIVVRRRPREEVS